MMTHWIAGIGRPNARVMNGKAKLTDESNGTTSVPSATTSTPKPAPEAAGGDAALHRLLQRGRGLEAHSLASLHLDGLAGARIQSLARLGLAHGKGAKARQGEFAFLLQRLDHGVHQFTSGAVRGGTSQRCGLLQYLRNERL